MKKHRRKKCRVYVGFIDLEIGYDRVNREALWQVLRKYDVGGKLLNAIKYMYIKSLGYVRVKEWESECSKIDTGVRQGCIMPPWLFNEYIHGCSDEGDENGDREERREWRLPGLLYADDLVLFG